MRHWRVIGVAAAVAVAAGFGVAQVMLARGHDPGATAPGELVAVSATLSPSVHAFGDPVFARVDVVVDKREIDYASVSVQPRFEPYEQLGPPRVTRSEAGALGRLRVEFRLVCLREGCDAAEARGVTDLQPSRVRYRFRGNPGNASKAFDWPLLEVASRVADDAVSDIKWRADESTLPAVTYRVAPVRAAVVLLLVALAFAAVAVLLAYRRWSPGRAAEESGGEVAVLRSPLERAFEAALAASDSGASADRRRALERVAIEFAVTGRAELAETARALAWSKPGSTTEEIRRLVTSAGPGSSNGPFA